MPEPQQIDYKQQVFQQLRARPTEAQLTYIFERMREAGWDTPPQPREADAVAVDLPQRRAQISQLFETMRTHIAEQGGDAEAGWAWLEQAIAEEKN